MASKKAVLGLLSNQTQADAAVLQLQRAGYLLNDISVIFPDPTSPRDVGHEKHTKAPEGAVIGGAAGAVVGGTLGLLVGIGALAIPGLGPLIAAGPIMALLSGAAVVGAGGGIAGGLIGMGVPEIEAKQFESKIRKGSVLISVHVEDRDRRVLAKKILEQMGATDVTTVGEQRVSARYHA